MVVTQGENMDYVQNNQFASFLTFVFFLVFFITLAGNLLVGAANKTKPKTRPTPVRKNVKPKPVKTKVYEPKTYKTPSDLNIKKPEVKPQKIEDYKDILVAVGFSASEAKQKAKSLLKKLYALVFIDLELNSFLREVYIFFWF